MDGRALIWGGIAGAVVAGVVVLAARKKMDDAFEAAGADLLTEGLPTIRREVMATVRSEATATVRRVVPGEVERTLVARLTQYNITPAFVSRVNRALDLADRVGLLGVSPTGLGSIPVMRVL